MPDGSCSTGHWEKGRKHGTFEEKDTGGKVTQVEWHLGKRLKIPEERKRPREERTLSSLTQSF